MLTIQVLVNDAVREERTLKDGPEMVTYLETLTVDLKKGERVKLKVKTESKQYVLDDAKSVVHLIKERLW